MTDENKVMSTDPDSRESKFCIVLPTTCRFYYWELKPFFELFNRYWGPDQEVVVMGDRDPGLDYPNLRYFDMPDQFRIDNMWIMHHWSSGMRWYMKEHMVERYFIQMQTDFWLTEPVDHEVIAAVVAYMQAHDDVIRVGICNWPGSEDNPYLVKDGEQDGVTFWRCKQKKRDCFLQMSNIPAMWNRDLLYEVWEDNWDSWACEIWGGNRLMTKFPDYKSVLCRPRGLTWAHVAYTREDKRVVLSNMPQEAAEIVRPLIPGGFAIA